MANRLEALLNVVFRPEDRKNVLTGDIEFSIKPSTKDVITGTQEIGTSEEALTVGDVSSLGLVVIKNLDETNFVEVGLTASYTIKLLPGQACLFPPAGTLYAKANTAACDVEYYVFPAA